MWNVACGRIFLRTSYNCLKSVYAPVGAVECLHRSRWASTPGMDMQGYVFKCENLFNILVI